MIMTSPELIFKSEKGRELLKELGAPEGYAHVCTVTLGYRDGDRPPVKPRNKEVMNALRPSLTLLSPHSATKQEN